MKPRSKKTRSANPGNGARHHNSKLSPLEQVREAVRTSNLPDLEWTTILGAYQEEGIRSLEDLARKMVETFRRPSSFPRPLDLSILSRRPTESIANTIVQGSQVPAPSQRGRV